MSKAVVVLCPGRGSYTASELGYLSRPVPASMLSELNAAIDRADGLRTARGNQTIRAMDGARTFSREFFRGENASGLTFACTAFDFLRLDHADLDIVAVGGNSMGWYSALFAAGVFGLDDAFDLIETMGGMTQNGQIGGQAIYPLVDDDWRTEPRRAAAVATALESVGAAGHQAGWSIRYGGYAVLWADEDGLPLLLAELPRLESGKTEYPLELPGHSAFHSPLMLPASERALDQLSRRDRSLRRASCQRRSDADSRIPRRERTPERRREATEELPRTRLDCSGVFRVPPTTSRSRPAR